MSNVQPVTKKQRTDLDNRGIGSDSGSNAKRYSAFDVLDDDHVHSTIREYLRVEVDPVKLPEIDNHHATYPPLILDGASGVGKTQQAFALLKGGQNQEAQNLVYILLRKDVYQYENNRIPLEPIYTEMTEKTGMESIFKAIGEVLEEWKEKATTSEVGMFSMNSIKKVLNSESATDYQEHPKLWALVALLCENVIECIPENFALIKRKAANNTGYEWFQKMYLENKVLFVDEALPSFVTEEDRNRLKFVTNLGRVLKMRVVLAATAAIAATMWTIPKVRKDHKKDLSRFEMTNFTLAEIQFLYKAVPAQFEIKTTKGTTAWSIKARPLLQKWLKEKMEKSGFIDDVTGYIADKITTNKAFTNESKFVWLSGACLSAKEKVSSPFLLQPSELVRDHYFEPAILTYVGGDGNDWIYNGIGYQELNPKMGDQRVKIIRAVKESKLAWILKGEESVGLSRDYNSVEYILSNCVQICLAREPLFAVAISRQNHYYDPSIGNDSMMEILAAMDFKDGFRKALPESPMQRTKGAVDGELHEYVIFAALQLACNPISSDEMHSVHQCVKYLHKYLRIEFSVIDHNKLAKEFGDGKAERRNESSDIQFNEFVDSSGVLYNDSTELSRMFSDSIGMPWMVPACDKAKLENKIKEYQADNNGNSVTDFFGDLNVAGLIPGTCNSRLDAHAYCWNEHKITDEGDVQLKLDWAFEFRARSGNYSKGAAMQDLMKKCGNEEAMKALQQERRAAKQALEDAKKALEDFEKAHKDDELTEELKGKIGALKADLVEKAKALPPKSKHENGWPKEQKPCHGMLIAIVNSPQSSCYYCAVTVDGMQYLRVIVFIGNALPPLKSKSR